MHAYWRIELLLALMSIVALIDWRLHGAAATKWREYGFLIIAGLLGALIGVVNDLITSTISPEYFVVGKGIPADGQFRMHVVGLGFQAGMLMGMLVGGIFLIANNPKPNRRSLAYVRLIRFAAFPVISAIALALIGSLLIGRADPLEFGSRMADLLTPIQIARFLSVWGAHLGIYAGGLLGTIAAVFAIRRKRLPVPHSD